MTRAIALDGDIPVCSESATPESLHRLRAKPFTPAFIAVSNAVKPGQWIANPPYLFVAGDLAMLAATLWPDAVVSDSVRLPR
jgi:hypothetical protein